MQKIKSVVFCFAIATVAGSTYLLFAVDEKQAGRDLSSRERPSPTSESSESKGTLATDDQSAELGKTLELLQQQRIQHLKTYLSVTQARLLREKQRSPEHTAELLAVQMELLDAELSLETNADNKVLRLKAAVESTKGILEQLASRMDSEAEMKAKACVLSLEVQLVQQQITALQENPTNTPVNSTLRDATAKEKSSPSSDDQEDPELRKLMAERVELLRKQMIIQLAKVSGRNLQPTQILPGLKRCLDAELEFAGSTADREEIWKAYLEQLKHLEGLADARSKAGLGGDPAIVLEIQAAILEATIAQRRLLAPKD